MSASSINSNPTHIQSIARELAIGEAQVGAVAQLLSEDATVPFISRYRKEMTGSLDEVAITAIRDRLDQLAELDKRRAAIIESLVERNLLTDELKGKIEAAEKLTELEDIYLPYRPKRRTRAMIAREKGLEPLAEWLLAQESPTSDPAAEAVKFINAELGVADGGEALAGARDIIAERVSEDQHTRERMRSLFQKRGTMGAKVVAGKEEEGAKFRDYFAWSEAVSGAPSHRILAMFRGENEGFLSVAIEAPEQEALQVLESLFVKQRGAAAEQVREAIGDGWKRLLAPSMETETRAELKKRADEQAIKVFVDNIRELLMEPALGRKRVLAIDPGFRTGCKVVVLDEQGKLLHDTVIFPTHSAAKVAEAASEIKKLLDKHQIEAIAIGNGTASREAETFAKDLGFTGLIVMVNESGASIYSASDVAREEFPDKDVTVRGAVSIGRRLMDPLAELVKIDPKSVGVGQYQHDVDQPALKRSLDDTVMSCVNRVGVEINTASKELLTYVSGVGPGIAKNIIDYRNENGAFKSRAELKKVKRLGPKAFEQCAGFIRVREAKNPLDASAVHPESYGIVEAMAKDAGCSVADLMKSGELRAKIDLQRYVADKVGMPTLRDIMEELAKPGRDPREKFEAFSFNEAINSITDVKPGMKLPGIVTNVTAFGAFVDVGAHCDGLVHVSQLADRFVKDPNEVVKVHQKVTVTVTEVDIPRKRIGLSMKANPGSAPQKGSSQHTAHSAQQKPKQASAPAQRGPRPEQTPAKPKNNWFSDALKDAKKN